MANLPGVRVLVVEDEMIVAMQIESILRKAGCEVIGPVGTLAAALTLAHEAALDAAVLDINLNGVKVFDVAEALQTRGVPFAFASGYADAAMPEKWRDLPRLSKPFRQDQLERVLADVLLNRAQEFADPQASSGPR